MQNDWYIIKLPQAYYETFFFSSKLGITSNVLNYIIHCIYSSFDIAKETLTLSSLNLLGIRGRIPLSTTVAFMSLIVGFLRTTLPKGAVYCLTDSIE